MAAITASSVEESDRVLNETTCKGKLTVTIEGEAENKIIDGIGEPLRTLVSTISAFNPRPNSPRIFATGASNNPWMLVSYDDEKKILIVRRK